MHRELPTSAIQCLHKVKFQRCLLHHPNLEHSPTSQRLYGKRKVAGRYNKQFMVSFHFSVEDATAFVAPSPLMQERYSNLVDIAVAGMSKSQMKARLRIGG